MPKIRPGTLVIVFNEDRSNILAVKRKDVPIWVLPGGGIDAGETPEQAAVREVLEESGLSVEVTRKSALYSPTNFLTAETHVFEARVIEGTPSPTDETVDVGFYPLSDLPYFFFPLHEIWIEEALANPNETIRRPLTEVNLWNLLAHVWKHPILLLRFTLAKLGFPINV